MPDRNVLLSHMMIASCLLGEHSLSILLAVYNAGSYATGPLLLAGNLRGTLSQVEYSHDGGENWQPWQGRCAIGSIKSKEEAILLLRGVQGQQTAAQELLLEVIFPYEGSVSCRITLPSLGFSDKRPTQCRYLSYDIACDRHCCLL